MFFSSFLNSRQRQGFEHKVERASADKMMVKAKGPVWHQKHKEQDVVPCGLRGLDRDATWSYSRADGWVYGHGTFCLCSHAQNGQPPVLGRFVWMTNSASEAKRLPQEVAPYKGQLQFVCMDSKADDLSLYEYLEQQLKMQLLTVPRDGMDKSPQRQRMIRQMSGRFHRMVYRQRSKTVEPMQALVKHLFDLDTCWMHGDKSNRWLFAAMGLAVQIAQRLALRHKRSTWDIKHDVLGL